MPQLFAEQNPNWKGGAVEKTCAVCSSEFAVKRANSKARYCSMQCVGVSQRGRVLGPSKKVAKACVVCAKQFLVFPAHVQRQECCSKQCSFEQRKKTIAGVNNPNWTGGLSRLPYPWNFRDISKSVIERDGGTCQSPVCHGVDTRMTAPHIDYDKQNCVPTNLIALCSSCNTRANFNRKLWQGRYERLVRDGVWEFNK